VAQRGALMVVVLWRMFKRRVLRSPRPTVKVAALLSVVLGYGSSGFLFFELPENPALSWYDAVWYSVVTVTSVGYGDYSPKTLGGRFLVAIPLMFFGIGLLGYVLSLAASALVQAKTKELHGMGGYMLKSHLVIFNFPSLAKVERVLDELTADPMFGRERDVVLVDEDLAELPPELVARGVLFVRGNPSRDETLTRADIDHAAHAVVLSKRPGDPHSDDQNVAITLAVEARQPAVKTIVECVDFATQELLRKAGSDGIVCTSRFDAHFLSHELLHPGLQEVVEQLTSNLRGQQIHLTRYDGAERSYAQVDSACRAQGHLMIGIQRGSATTLNLDPTATVRDGDRVISIGSRRIQSFAT
jgi:voltage-gated potassium channel